MRVTHVLVTSAVALFFGCGSPPEANTPAAEVGVEPLDSLAPDTFVAPLDAPVTTDAPVAPDTADSSVTDAPVASKVTTLRIHYPAGSKSISVRGSVAPWSWTKGVATKAGSDDTYTLESDAITGPAEWKPLIDDTTWSRGPNYKVSPGETVDVYPHFNVTKGTLEKKWSLDSKVLGNTRGIWVYLPPTYVENARARFPVVYMHDGQNLFDPKLAFGGNEWKVDETMDAAAEDGSIREAVVIGVENTSARMSEYTPTKDPSYGGGNADNYLKMLVTELKPKVDTELRVLTGANDTVLVGSSLGGLVSSYAGITQPSTFGLIGAMSPSTWWDGTVILSKVAASKGATPKPLRVYVDSGDAGSSKDDMANTKKLADTYQANGYVEGTDLKYVVQSGASHSEVYWAQRLPAALAFLLGKRPST